MDAGKIDVMGLPRKWRKRSYEFQIRSGTANNPCDAKVDFHIAKECKDHADELEAALNAQAPVPRHTRSGIFDKNGRELVVGDRVRVLLNGPSTKEEYWNPEYVVVWAAPSFGLKWVGGGKDSSTARWYFGLGTPQGSDRLESLTAAPPSTTALQARVERLEEALRDALEAGSDGDWQSARQTIRAALASEVQS